MQSTLILLLVALSGACAQLLAPQAPLGYYPQTPAAYGAYPQQQQAYGAYPQAPLPYGAPQQPYGAQPQATPLTAFQLSQISTISGAAPVDIVGFIQQAQHQPWMVAELAAEVAMEPFQFQQIVQQANALTQTGQDLYQLANQATYAQQFPGANPQAGAYPQAFPQAGAYPQIGANPQAGLFPQQPYGAQAQTPLTAFQLSQIATLSGVTPFQIAQTIQQVQYQPWMLNELATTVGLDPFQLNQLVQQANLLAQTGQDIFQLAQQATYQQTALPGAYQTPYQTPYAPQQALPNAYQTPYQTPYAPQQALPNAYQTPYQTPYVPQQAPFYPQSPVYQQAPLQYIPPAPHANILVQQPLLIPQRAISPRFAPRLAQLAAPQLGYQQQGQQQGGLIQNVQSFFHSLGL